MKILLLDIDHTLFYERTPRPFLREFLEWASTYYRVLLYTAAHHERVTDVCRILHYQLDLPRTFVNDINRYSMSHQRCPMIDYGSIQIKCLRKAAEKLGVPYDDIAYLIDDMPMHDNPDRDKRIQAPGFWGQQGDTYLRDLPQSL